MIKNLSLINEVFVDNGEGEIETLVLGESAFLLPGAVIRMGKISLVFGGSRNGDR